MTETEILFLIFPALIGYLTSMTCDIGSSAGKSVAIRPPAWVFGVVWPILYFLIGYAWVLASRKNMKLTLPYYTILSIILGLWIVVYGCKKNKKGGVYILAMSIAAALACFAVSPDLSQVMLSPLIAWLLLATFLNIFEVENS